MAGIGEVSAIITIADVGITLSKALIAYVGEVKDAGLQIQGVADEISSVSDRLKEAAELAERNTSTRLFSEEGLRRLRSLAASCEGVLDQIRDILKWTIVGFDPDHLSGDKIDISRLAKLRWPLIQSKLDLPRARLVTLKIDLLLLYDSVKLASARTLDERVKLAERIPKLEHSRKWAERQQAAAMRRRHTPGHLSSEMEGADRLDQTLDSDAENLQEFLAFKERRLAEEIEAELQKELAWRQHQENEKAKEEALKQKALEEEAIRKWEIEQATTRLKEAQERQQRNTLIQQKVRQELERLKVPSGEIEKAIQHATQEEPPNMMHDITIGEKIGTSREQSQRLGVRSLIRRLRPRKPHARKSSTAALLPRAPWDPVTLEAWVLDYMDLIRLWLSDARLEEMIQKQNRSRRKLSIWERLAFLDPLEKSLVNELMIRKNAAEVNHQWVLAYLDELHRKTRDGEQVALVLIIQRMRMERIPSENVNSPLGPSGRPSSYGVPSLPSSPIIIHQDAPGDPYKSPAAKRQDIPSTRATTDANTRMQEAQNVYERPQRANSDDRRRVRFDFSGRNRSPPPDGSEYYTSRGMRADHRDTSPPLDVPPPRPSPFEFISIVRPPKFKGNNSDQQRYSGSRRTGGFHPTAGTKLDSGSRSKALIKRPPFPPRPVSRSQDYTMYDQRPPSQQTGSRSDDYGMEWPIRARRPEGYVIHNEHNEHPPFLHPGSRPEEYAMYTEPPPFQQTGSRSRDHAYYNERSSSPRRRDGGFTPSDYWPNEELHSNLGVTRSLQRATSNYSYNDDSSIRVYDPELLRHRRLKERQQEYSDLEKERKREYSDSEKERKQEASYQSRLDELEKKLYTLRLHGSSPIRGQQKRKRGEFQVDVGEAATATTNTTTELETDADVIKRYLQMYTTTSEGDSGGSSQGSDPQGEGGGARDDTTSAGAAAAAATTATFTDSTISSIVVVPDGDHPIIPSAGGTTTTTSSSEARTHRYAPNPAPPPPPPPPSSSWSTSLEPGITELLSEQDSSSSSS